MFLVSSIFFLACIYSFFALEETFYKSCDLKENQVELLVEYGTINAYPDRSTESIEACPCGDIGVKFIWNSSNEITSNMSFEYWQENTPRYFIHKINGFQLNPTLNWRTTRQIYDWDKPRYAAFVLESGYTNSCNDICMCDIDDNCYHFSNGYGYVELIPFCEDNKCSMYAMTYRNNSIVTQNFKQSNLYGLLQNINGTTYEFPEPFNSSFGIHSPYLKINRISCNGCARIQKAKCTTSTKVAEACNSNDYVGLTVTFPTYFLYIAYLKSASATCQCDNGIRYLWEKPKKESNETILQLDICDKSKLCICTTNGDCYQDMDYTATSYSAVLNLVCTDSTQNNCYMQALVDGKSIKNIYNESQTIPYKTKVDSISCLGCGAIMNERKCYATQETFDTNDTRLLPYPALYYNYKGLNLTLLDVLTLEYVDMNSDYTLNLIDWFCGKAYFDITEYDSNNYLACDTSAFAKYNKYVAGGYNLMMYYFNTDEDLFMMNFIFRLAFGLPALLLSIFVTALILKQPLLRTSYGIICVSISIIDILLLLNIVLAETLYDIRSMGMNQLIASNSDKLPPLNIFGLRIDLITYYFFAVTLATSIFLGTAKSFQRFLAIYAPIFFSMRVSNAIIVKIIVASIIFFLLAFLPILVFSLLHDIGIWYIYGAYDHGTCSCTYDASIIVKYVRDGWDYGNIFVALILDIATAIKLFIVNRKKGSDWSKQKATIERLFLLQNFTNAFIFVVYIITSYMFIYVCHAGSATCRSNFLQRFVVMFYNFDSSRVMWRFFDELVTLAFQLRAYKILTKPSTTATTTVTPISYLSKVK